MWCDYYMFNIGLFKRDGGGESRNEEEELYG